ncbi:MAG TPA: XRE family transcriptional regulator [Micromonosporaceae bacterium]|nr:XRE family transcriptional regulator [Micromonosporaceae bacterium]HCU49507.1 XRE family transcriptional regulator [Micromonosporaceae bacterium]
MQCRACGANADLPGGPALCPACLAVTGGELATGSKVSSSALWLWTSAPARQALATGDLGVIIKAWRAATGTNQRTLAEDIGYDPTYISMIETGRRDIVDVDSRRRFAKHLGIPPRIIGVTDAHDADHIAMLQFGHSTLRLATLARRNGQGATAVNELWPLVARLEARTEQGLVDRDLLILLSRARAELGVSLGYVLPEERLAAAVRWTGKALHIAERLEDTNLHAYTLRVHGNELRKAGRLPAAFARLTHAAAITSPERRAAVLLQLARITHDPDAFDATIAELRGLAECKASGDEEGLLNPTAIREAHLRGLLATGRTRPATNLLDHPAASGWVPPQWRIIERITIAEVLIASGDPSSAQTELAAAIAAAEEHRLPHQLQRASRAAVGTLPGIAMQAHLALQRVTTLPP